MQNRASRCRAIICGGECCCFMYMIGRQESVHQPPVDLLDESIDLIDPACCMPDMDAARHGDLHEPAVLAVVGMCLQQPIQASQALGNALGVVDADRCPCPGLIRSPRC